MKELEKYGVTAAMSSEEKLDILQKKQVELLERLDVIDDEVRHKEIEADLAIIESEITSIFDVQKEEITALRRDKNEDSSSEVAEDFKDLKGNGAEVQSQASRYSEAEKKLDTYDYKAGVSEIEKLANEGYAKACYKLGELYSKGHRVTKNAYIAADWYKKAVDMSSDDDHDRIKGRALHGLGSLYTYTLNKESGSGKIALDCYEKAIEAGDISSWYSLYIIYSKGLCGKAIDNNKAMECLLKKVENAPDDSNHREIGEIYLYGKLDQKKDYKKAEEHYRMYLTAHDGLFCDDKEALNNMGNCCWYNGKYDEAMSWYEKATKLGNNVAAENIAKLYEKQGKLEEAYDWYFKAKDMGNKNVANAINRLREENGFYSKQDVEEIEKGYNSMKLSLLATAFETGTKGVPKDEERAKEIRNRLDRMRKADAQAFIISIAFGLIPFIILIIDCVVTDNNLGSLFNHGGFLKIMGIQLLSIALKFFAMKVTDGNFVTVITYWISGIIVMVIAHFLADPVTPIGFYAFTVIGMLDLLFIRSLADM